MASADGMVAVVRGLRESGLAVTLLDGNKQYTLMPNAAPPSPASDMRLKHDVASQHSEILEIEQPVMCDSGAQATDGRYASIYKMSHCRIKPTSPPVQLTEFPPQRAEINRGQGNFEIGGCGSGESYTPCKYNDSFRGGMSWPERGSVCSPRQSRQPDAFANSLRKYPNVSAERSTELVERLINYTQAKHSKSYQSKSPSPSRHGNENNILPYQVADRCSTRSIHRSPSYQKKYDLDTNTYSRTRNRLEESPTRDIIRPRNSSIEYDYDDYRRRNLDTKDVKDISQKVKDCMRTMNSCSYTQNCVDGRERVKTLPYGQMPVSVSILAESKSASIEVQAAVKMVSKEVSTQPKLPSMARPVAVPHSSAVSKEDRNHKGEVSVQVTPKPNIKPVTKYQWVQASTTGVDLSIQTNSSSEELTNTSNVCQYCALNNTSKSEEKLTLHIDLQGEIMDLLERVSVCPSVDPEASELRRKVFKRISIKLQRLSRNLQTEEDRDRAKIQIRKMLKYVPVWIPFGDVQAYRDAIAEEIIYKICQFKTTTQVYRIEVPPFEIGSQPHDLKNTHDLKSIIRDWMNTLPIKSYDAFGMPMDKKHIINKYVTRIHKIILHKLRDITSDDLRKELLNFTYKIPMNVHISHKLHFLNQVIATLINRIHKIAKERINVKKSCATINFETKTNDNKLIRHVEKTRTKLKQIISDHLKDLFQHIIFCDDLYVSYVESELIDIILESMQDIRAGKDINVAEEIVLLLEESGITDESQAKSFVKKLLAQIKEVLKIENANHKKCTTIKSQSYIVFQNTINTGRNNNQIPSFENSNVNKSDIDYDTNNYIEQLTQQIEEWLKDSKMTMPYAQDKGFRQVVIHDLAGDIVDRRKYIDFNPSSRGSDEDELEHLKYQIFKWINKLVGEENMKTLDHAPELMQRIQSIPVPVFTQHQNVPGTEALSNGCMRPSCPESMKNSTSPSNGDRIPNQVASNQSMVNQNMSNHTTSNRRMSNQINPDESLRKSSLKGSFTKISSPCCNDIPTTQQHPPSPRQLNEEYDNYLKNWVKEIPIPSSTTEELELAEKARQGIYNGIWKALTKLKLDPAIFHNVFYYEDAFDEELEELLKCLPDTPEMKRKKHLLKVKLIEMTTKTNEMISNTAAPASFRQQLVENVENGLPTKQRMLNDNNDNSKQSFDELQVQKLVDDYILCAKFKESNKSKAEVYRKKLIIEAHAIVKNIKKIHGKELKDINTDLYVNNILNALHKVPLPTLDILEDEANEIEVSQEIDMWFADLHVIRKDDDVDQQQTNKLKDALVKRIMDLEKEINILDCSGEKALKHEISLFLEKVPIQNGNVNLDFIAEEFANRLKNKARESQADNIGKKSVAFLDSVGYYEFSLQMPGCSSFSEMPLRPALVDQSSYMIKDGNIEKMTSPRCLQFGPERSPEEIPSNEYLTIHDSRAPKPQPVSRAPVANVGNLQVGNPSAFNDVQPKSKPNQCCQLAGNAQFAENSQQQKIMPDIPPYQCGIQSQLATSNMPRVSRSLDQRTLNTMTPTTEPNSCCKRNNRASINLPVAHHQSYPDYMSNVPATQAPSIFSSRIGQGLMNNNEVQQGFNNVVNSPQRHSPFDSEPTPNMHQSLPIIEEAPDRSASYQSLEQPLNQLSTGTLHTGTRNLLGNMTSYGQPQGFSTPQHQGITQDLPLRPDRKRSRRQQGLRGNFAKRRLDLDDESDNASEKDDICPCMRMWRCTREPIYYAYEDFAMERPGCYPFPYSCPNLY